MPEETKLSAELFDVFQRYKRATGKVIKWLAIQSGNNDITHIRQSWTLEDLRRAAEIVKRNAIEVPENILYAFQDAIGSRTDISGHFKHSGGDNEQKTTTHEFFTTTLKDIFKSLCGARSPAKRADPPPLGQLERKKHLHVNRFHALESMINNTVPDSEQYSLNRIPEDEMAAKTAAEAPTLESVPEEDFSIAGDNMTTIFGMYYLLVEMDIICSKVKYFWEEAAKGTMSIVFATWLTSAAFSHVERSFDEDGPWSETLHNADHMEMCAMFKFFMEEMDGHNEPVLPPWVTHKSHGIFTSGHGLITPGKTLFCFKGAGTMGIETTKPSLFEKPADHITIQRGSRDGPRQVDSERDCLTMMLNSMERLGKNDKRAGALSMRDLNPLVEKTAAMSPEDVLTMRPDVVFGLQLLIESYKSFLFGNGATPTKVNCRLQALKFAGEVKKSIMRVLRMRPPRKRETCTCKSCTEQLLRQGLEFLEQDLSSFTGERRFDLYYQAPWVAGSQMLEILSQATDYGLLLCNRFQYVGAVLHLYNCLRQVGAIKKDEILLEKLCNLLEKVVFKGPKPDHNFYSRFIVFLGGKIEFDRSRLRRKKEAQPYDMLEGGDIPFHGRDRSWRMAMPEYFNRNQLTIAEHSHFYALHASRFGFTSPIAGDAWARFYGNRIGNRPVDDNLFVACINKMYETTFVDTLERMDRELKPEMEGEFPIARINWFEVYLTCTEILEKTAIAKLREPTSPYVSGEGDSYVTYGVRFTETFLDLADELTATKGGKKEFPYQVSPSIGYFKNAVKSALKGKTTADFVWQI